MPKHGWKWRTEQVRALHEEEIRALLLCGNCSARLAKWVYKNYPDLAIAAIDSIGWHDERRDRRFLWKELEKRKAEPFGDWVIVALGRSCQWWPGEAERYLELYDDLSAHLMTRGSAVFGMMHAVSAARMHESSTGFNPMSPQTLAKIRDACIRAIHDQENPYARAGACWLGAELGGLDEELAPLANDHTPIQPGEGLTVASHFESP